MRKDKNVNNHTITTNNYIMSKILIKFGIFIIIERRGENEKARFRNTKRD